MATLDDIAQKANVSKSAVSLVLNNKEGVGEETRRKILNIAKELGYVPRSLIKAEKLYSPSNVIRFLACIKEDIVSTNYQNAPFFFELLHALEDQCRIKDYSLVVSSLSLEQLEEGIKKLENNHPSNGIILLGTNLTSTEVETVISVQSNVVVLDAKFDLLNVNAVVMNNSLGAHQAASHLMKLGHENIGYVQSRTRINNFEERKSSFLSTLSKNNIVILDENYFDIHPEISQAKKDFKEVLKKRDTKSLPTALFCENDYLAIGVIKALQDSGIKIPDDISVIGFDNIPQCKIISPELTTIQVEKDKMGKMAINRLIEVIQNKDTMGVEMMINTSLIVRGSCRSV